ncbi:hypothetical protein GCM10029978_068190 [Actinoallomurus acanthiterrae]
MNAPRGNRASDEARQYPHISANSDTPAVTAPRSPATDVTTDPAPAVVSHRRLNNVLGWAGTIFVAFSGADVVAAPPPAWPLGVAAVATAFTLTGRQWLLSRQHRAIQIAATQRVRRAEQYADAVQVGATRRIEQADLRAADAAHRADESARQIEQLRTRLVATSQATRHAIAYVSQRRLPATLQGQTTPPIPIDEHLDPMVRRLLDEIIIAAAEATKRHRDHQEAMRAAVVAFGQHTQPLAHRLQEVATRQLLEHPDESVVEAGMRIDHVAAVIARYAQNRRVLCGDWPGQQWTEALPLTEVVRAASGRIISYERVEIRSNTGQDAAVAARAAEALIHVVAELLANAAQSSPPRTPVIATVTRVQQGAVIEIDDCGVGMDESRLEQARQIASGRRRVVVEDLGESVPTGLVVVGLYADRFGFRVDLRGVSPYGGLHVVVGIPEELIEPIVANDVLTAAPPRGMAVSSRHAEPGVDADEGTVDELPRRRSRRRDTRPAETARLQTAQPDSPQSAGPAAATPEEAGEWLRRFLRPNAKAGDSPDVGVADDTDIDERTEK